MEPELRPSEGLRTSDLLKELARLRDEQRVHCAGVATTAHDIKSTLSAVSGCLQLLAGERLGSVTTGQRECMRDMEAALARLRKFSSELLTYGSRNNKQNLRFKPADIGICVTEIHREWVSAYQVKGVELKLECHGTVPPFRFDKEKIQRALACLLDNALKFTPAGRSVRLALEPHYWERRCAAQAAVVERRRGAKLGPNSVLSSVIDEGPGIAPEYQQEIFEGFYSMACGGAMPGTGLGLAIARDIVHLHGGKIWVESQPGAGSKFCFVLPYVQRKY
jgi:signal transduction histidine kinase